MLLLVLAALVFSAIHAHNRVVRLHHRFQNASAQIGVQRKRRYALIPHLAESATAYMAHERGALQEVMAARNGAEAVCQKAAARAGNGPAVQTLAQAERQVGVILGRLMALSEAYPELKANQTMGQLMEALDATENRSGFARQAFNDAVMFYNTAYQTFPLA